MSAETQPDVEAVYARGTFPFLGLELLVQRDVLIPRAETELLAQCKHCPPVDDAFRARTAERVETFLARR